MKETNNSDIKSIQSEETEFKREIGLFGGVNILAGIMIGSGIFYLGSYVLMYSGMSQGLSLLVWVIGGLVTLLSGLCFAELGAMMPKAGGSYVYLNKAYGSRVSFMSGFSSFVVGFSGSIAALAIALVKIIETFFLLGFWGSKLAAIGFIVVLSAINYVGVKFGSLVQNIFNMSKLLPIGIILFGGLFLGKQKVDLSLVPKGGASFSQIIGMVAFGVVATLWAYEGWTNLNVVSEEIKNPKKNIPLAIIISIVSVMVLYVLFNFSIYRVLPMETITQMIGSENYYIGTESAKVLFGDTGSRLVGAAMLIAIFGSLNGCVMVAPRCYYSMSKNGVFFDSFQKLHPKYKTPTNAIIASMIVSSVLVLLFSLGDLTMLVTFGGLIFNALTFYSVVIFRQKYPDLERPYKVWFYPVSVYIIVAVMIGLMINTFINNPLVPLWNIAVPLTGLLIHIFVFERKGRVQK